MSLIADHCQAAPLTGEATAPPIAWNEAPDIALDLNGPVSVPYTPFDPAWLDQPILDLFGRLAERQPDRIAIDDGLLRLTRGQLWAVAGRLGRAIADLGAPPGPIAVVLPHAATYWAGVFGCLAAGRACILLDRDAIAERNANVIADARPAALVTDAEGAHRYQAWASGIPIVPIEMALLGDGSPQPAARLDPDAPAFILYTSGSSGRPKGIVLSQRAILYRAKLVVDATHLGEGDRVVVAGEVASHAGLRQWDLLSGATMYPVDMRRLGFSGLVSRLRDQRVTVLDSTPSLLRVLARLEGAREALGSLRMVRVTGEPLMHADLRRLREHLPHDCAVLNAFNATESPLTQWFVPPDDARTPVLVAAGYPTGQSAVLDEDGRCCPAGEMGELVVRGRYVALGEWQDGRLVAGRMQPDHEDQTLRIYPTGDLVRQGADGVIVVVGRKDRQLKIRGQRVEPIEIEGVLRCSPDVLEAAVLPRIDGEDVRLLAFVVPAAAGDAELVNALRASLAASLPVYMQPSSITLLDAMPLLPGGKIDAQALLAGDRPTRAASGAQPPVETAPSAGAQAMVAHAWARVLDRVSLEQDLPFDRAEGDSLRLIQLVFYLERQCGAVLPLDAFTADLTPGGFADVLDRVLAARPAASTGAPRVFLLPGTSKRDPKLDRLRRLCAGSLNIVPIDYGDWFEWVSPGFDLEDLAARVAARIEALAPTGPIVLAGYSFGGLVAPLAAQRLMARGRHIALVAILATDGRLQRSAGDPVAFLTQSPSLKMIRAMAAAGQRARTRDALVRKIVGRLLHPPWAPVLRLLARDRPFNWLGDYGFFLNWLLSQALLHRISQEWKAGSRPPEPMLAPTVAFRPLHDEPPTPADLGWGDRCPNLQVYDVVGDHSSMLDEPQLRPLCAHLAALIAAAVQSPPASSSVAILGGVDGCAADGLGGVTVPPDRLH